MSWSQTILETILNVQATERKKVYRQLQQKGQTMEDAFGKAEAMPKPAARQSSEPKGRYL